MTSKSAIDQLIFLFSKLPGLGPRSAKRIILHLMQDKDIRLTSLIDGLTDARQKICHCSKCGNIDVATICGICADETRNKTIICVVETVSELWAIERSKIFNGNYHVLGTYSNSAQHQATIAARISKLLQRCLENNVQEIILAMNSTLEGQTTAYFIVEHFKDHKIIVSRLASGIPIGGELDYFDEGTLSAAITSRHSFE